MALPEKKEEPNRIENREHREHEEHQKHGHEFARDIHPERYPRESLSRLEEGILQDEELRHEHDRLAYAGPDAELRVDDARSLSRTLMVLGGFLLIFAWVLLLWVGWDVRSGEMFFSVMCVISITVGLGLLTWGFVERQRVMRLRASFANPIQERVERVPRERKLTEGDRAA